MKERRVRKSTEKPAIDSLFGCGGTVAACSVEDDRCIRSHRVEDIQQPTVPTSDSSQQRTAYSGQVCHQYQRRRQLQNATSERNSAIGRLGIASHLL